MSKIIAVDFDGTLFKNEIEEAIDACKKRGIEFDKGKDDGLKMATTDELLAELKRRLEKNDESK